MRNLKKIGLVLSALVIVAGLVCALTIGVGDGAQFTGERRYYASVSADAEIDALDTRAMSGALSAAAGHKVDVSFATNYQNGGTQLNIRSTPATYEISAEALVAALHESYESLGVESLSVEVTQATYSLSAAAALAAVMAVMLVVGLVAALIMVGGAVCWKIALLALHDLLLAFSLFVFTRSGSFPALAATLLATLALSLLLNIRRFAQLDRALVEHKTAEEAMNAACCRAVHLDFTVVGLLFFAAMLITSAVTGYAVLSSIGVCGLIAVFCSLYSSSIFAAGFWASSIG